MADCDDKQIVADVLAGDVEQFALLVRQYHRPLLHLSTNKLGCPEMAEDAVQDAFVCAYRSLHTYKPQYAFRTWLWTILLNQCRRHGSRQAKLKTTQTDTTPEQISDRKPDDFAMEREREIVLRELLTELPEVQADAIRFRFFGHLQYKQIAHVMQSSLSAAKQRVRYGLEALSKLAQERNLADSVYSGDQHEDRS